MKRTLTFLILSIFFFITGQAQVLLHTSNDYNYNEDEDNSIHQQGQNTIIPTIGLNIANITNSNNDNLVGLRLGVNIKHTLTDKKFITAGILFSTQGFKNKKHKSTNKLSYINVPVLYNYYVLNNFALKIGLQPGVLISAKYKNHYYKDNIKKYCNTFDISIPIGVSYDYKKFIFDAHYNIGMTHNFKRSKCKNKVIEFSVGYKLSSK